MSLKEADSLTPQIRLSTIIKELEPADVETDNIIVASPTYQKTLSSVLSSTSKEVLQSYFMWKAIQAFASVTESEALLPYTRFQNELQGKVKYPTASRILPC